MMPIAEDDSGNIICIGTQDHRVYFWDHESDEIDIICDGFDDLIDKLEYFDDTKIGLKKITSRMSGSIHHSNRNFNWYFLARLRFCNPRMILTTIYSAQFSQPSARCTDKGNLSGSHTDITTPKR